MKKVLLSTLVLCFATVSLNTAQAKDRDLKARIEAASAPTAPLNSLSAADFDAFSQHLKKGKLSWVSEVPAFAKRSDGDYAQALTISLAWGLEHNPEAVLEILDDSSPTLSVNHVCGLPFSDISVPKADDYIKKTREGLQRLTTTTLQDKKASCLKVLNGSAGMSVTGRDYSQK
ncbi:hypothetical protein [Serratia sp. M24T3]|uniref:hypothetical protein n=1 Tax=Serratia sp. M24T3 TaxID=932213 RepID=UPI00025B9B7C|nr:hypothetical protein [Serratia sp. M24T3]EIC85961.1 hypothetical protein SPM24T3_04097 [Serratia sp. M24T3]